ncbi:hypothetical protein [Clostridium ihumii]|uniref:hypothetical protein n=1 Tax=Clostridium ihumii TaxID=1470356 RepID=UPI00058F7DA9|nr:hypothetical protein [Clostridium ihumii]
MYISVENLFFIILSILGGTALVFLIIFLSKGIKFLQNLNSIIEKNEGNVTKVIDSLPEAAENIVNITDNVKNVSEAVNDVTEEVVETKDSLTEYLKIGKDIFAIVKDVFSK